MMIKIFEHCLIKELEKEVNGWITNCGSKINDIQFRTSVENQEIVYSCCVVTELNLHNR